MDDIVLETRDLTKHYGGVHALQGANFKLHAGEHLVQRALASAIAADDRDNSAVVDSEIDTVDGDDRAIAAHQTFDFEKRLAHGGGGSVSSAAGALPR